MKKSLVFTLLGIGIVLLLAITNPSQSEYTSWLEQVAINKMGGGALASGLVNLFGGSLINGATTENNYVLFTTYTTRIDSQDYITSIGILHQFIPIQENGLGNTPSSTDQILQNRSAPSSNSTNPNTSNNANVTTQTTQPIQIPSKNSTVRIISANETYSLPVVYVKASYGLDGDYPLAPSQPIAPIKFNLPSQLASSMSLYWVTSSIDGQGFDFIAPSYWTVSNAGIGADGSGGLKMTSGDGEQLNFGYEFNGPAASSIYTYFPDMENWAINYWGSKDPIGSPLPNANYEYLSKNTVSYSYTGENNQYPTNGVAVEETKPYVFLGDGEIVSANHQLATTVLNFFLQQTINEVK